MCSVCCLELEKVPINAFCKRPSTWPYCNQRQGKTTFQAGASSRSLDLGQQYRDLCKASPQPWHHDQGSLVYLLHIMTPTLTNARPENSVIDFCCHRKRIASLSEAPIFNLRVFSGIASVLLVCSRLISRAIIDTWFCHLPCSKLSALLEPTLHSQPFPVSTADPACQPLPVA